MNSFGIVSIVNKGNGKKFIFKSKNLAKKIGNTRNQLNFGCHYNHELQDDWNKLGPDNFSFNILDSNIENEYDLDAKFIEFLKGSNYVYNKDVTDLIQPLDCDIQLLTNKLYDFTGNEINTQSFIQKLQQHGLSNQDGFNFKVKFINQINQGQINHANFEEEYENFFTNISENKILNSLNSTLDELNFDRRMDNYGFTEEAKLRIVKEIENKIVKSEINSKEDISKKLNSLIEEEYYKKLKKDKIFEQFYDLTGKENSLKRELKYELNSKGLTNETGFKIKNKLKKLIEKGEVTEFTMEDTLKILIDEEFEKIQNKSHAEKQVLINFLDEMDFDEVLWEHDLHENHQYYIKEEIILLINQNQIKSKDDIEIKSFRLIKDLEINDVESRLRNLDGKIVDKIIVNNNLKSGLMLRKQSKVNKIINNVPVKIIKEDLAFFTGNLKPKFVPNPNVVYCPQCATKHKVGTVYCYQCGSKIK